MLEQLQKNQKSLTSGLEDIIMFQNLPDTPDTPQEKTILPIDYKPAMLEPDSKPDLKHIKFDMNSGFSVDEIKKLTEYKLSPPSQVLLAS